MTDAEPDTRLKINIKPHGVGWAASSPAKPKLDTYGHSPEDALEWFVCEIQADVEKGATVKSEITGVSALIEIYVPENHALTEFGIGGEENPAPEIPTVPYGETHIHLSAGCLEAMHDAAVKIREESGDMDVDGEGKETPSTAADQTCSTCKFFSRGVGPFPSKCNLHDTDTEGSAASCPVYYPDFYTQIRNGIRNGKIHVYGLSMAPDATQRLLDGCKWILIPKNTTHTPVYGTTTLVYETGKRKAYVGHFFSGITEHIDREQATSQEWLDRLQMSVEEVAMRYGTDTRAIALQVLDYGEFLLPYSVPSGEKAPRGLNWLTREYLIKLFPGVQE